MQIPDEVRKSVFFVLYKDKDQNLRFAGTGFFVSMQSEYSSEKTFIYMVTAKHVVIEARNCSSDDHIYARINTRDGGSKLTGIRFDAWQSHSEDSVDAAIFQQAVDPQEFDYLTIPIEMVVDSKVIHEETIGVGDEIFLAGLFVNYFGQNKNIPIIRVGNIAAMPEERIQVSNFGEIEAYLVEARSIGGLSGSPVFVHLSGVRVKDGQTQLRGKSFYWLGLMHGHYDLRENRQNESDSLSREAINMGIGIVVPATKILEILNQPYFSEIRKKAG